MQQDLPETSRAARQSTNSTTTPDPQQHGSLHHGTFRHQPRRLPDRVDDSFADRVNAVLLDERLRGLSARSEDARPKLAGQRVSEYESALTPSSPRQALGFKVIKRPGVTPGGVQLSDFPNEILTQIMSHLHPDSHTAVALVSKRFYALVTTPHAWQLAFQRFFPGQEGCERFRAATWDQDSSDHAGSEAWHFTRLTEFASWRSEYLLRTRLLRSLARGKPSTASGGIGASSRTSQSAKKASAVLTYNSKLPSMVTHLHAFFPTSGKKSPRVIHAATDLCVASASDPTTGKTEKWGLDDPFTFPQLEEVIPSILPYGIGEGPAAVPNVMGVSQQYGVVGGQGFPGGRVFFRPGNEFRGKYLGQEPGLVEAHPDIPKIPELSEGISALWIAQSPAVPSVTQLMVGIMTGSTLGVVTTYALGSDPAGPRYASGGITARWVVSPGVPIVGLRVDDSYSSKRKMYGRVWAVALNALGEVYYLTQPPIPPVNKIKTDESVRLAWISGRTTYWQLVEDTRRQARPDESGKNAVRGAYSPRSPANSMNLNKEQIIAEAREIERFLRYKPSHFRKVCHGWDMRRKLEVDFASDAGTGAGENIFVIDCGIDGKVAKITRLCRTVVGLSPASDNEQAATSTAVETSTVVSSIFGGGGTGTCSAASASDGSLGLNVRSDALDEWRMTPLISKDLDGAQITASGLDGSMFATTPSFEDPVRERSDTSTPGTPTAQSSIDTPGRRARFIGMGTNTGKIILWNTRSTHRSDGIQPTRLIQTDSPEISCLALSALYLVHGGSDGLVQAWDPLASTLDPIRTLNSRSPGRLPRHLLSVNPALRGGNFSAVGAIFLDPDPTILRGIVAFGSSVRYWSYSSSSQPTGRKRRLRHSDYHGQAASRRHGGGFQGFIDAETEELRNEQNIKAREQARLRSRFGVGLSDLTEEEAMRYAEMMSQESFVDEQRRTSASDTGSAADFDTTSNTGSFDTVTPEPSITSTSPPVAGSSASVPIAANDEGDYELQIQTALRLSLLEAGGDGGQWPQGNSSSGDFEISADSSVQRGNQPGSGHAYTVQYNRSNDSKETSFDAEDDDLRRALELSLAEEESRREWHATPAMEDEFPALEGNGVGKGKGKGKTKVVWG